MRMLALPRYGALGASSRMRSLQYLPHLIENGISVDTRPLLGDCYVRKYYAGRRDFMGAASGYLARFFTLVPKSQYDALLVEKEFFPWLPFLMEIFPRNAKLVLDFDDAIFHNYDLHPSWCVRWLLGSKIDRLMARADLVVVGNSYLGDRARAAGARCVEWVPTVVDLDRYPKPPQRAAERRRLRVGWIGSPATHHYLALLADVIVTLKSKHDVEFIAIGAGAEVARVAGFTAVQWSEDSEVESLWSLDIGIMPLIDGPWERGKCGYKLIQYMACGLPVVASPVGVNVDIVREGENGFSATSAEEWIAALDRLLGDAALRHRLGQAGRRDVEATYSLQVQGPRLVELLKSLGAR